MHKKSHTNYFLLSLWCNEVGYNLCQLRIECKCLTRSKLVLAYESVKIMMIQYNIQKGALKPSL